MFCLITHSLKDGHSDALQRKLCPERTSSILTLEGLRTTRQIRVRDQGITRQTKVFVMKEHEPPSYNALRTGVLQ